MTDAHERAALYREIAADGRRRVVDETSPDAEVPYAALVVARGANRQAVLKALQALRDAQSIEDE
ncbi:MAG: hypothetical protein V7603_4800 [Micromonosporaceae bacterium]